MDGPVSDSEMSFDPKEIWVTSLIDVEDANGDLTVGLSALRRYAVSRTNVIGTFTVSQNPRYLKHRNSGFESLLLRHIALSDFFGG